MHGLRAAPLLAGLIVSSTAFIAESEDIAPSSSPVSVRSLSEAAFNELPDQVPVEFAGRVLNKRQFLVEMEGRFRAAQGRKPPDPNFMGAHDPEIQKLKASVFGEQWKRIDANNRAVSSKLTTARASPAGGSPGPVPASCGAPVITGLSTAGPVSPGTDVIVKGCGFGRTGGEVRLVGEFPPTGTLVLRIVKPWSDDVLVARVPRVSGVMNQSTSKVQVVTGEGRASEPLPLAFEAPLEVLQLAQSDLSIACGASSPYDDCPNVQETCTGWATLGAMHTSDDAAALAGVDVARISLKNGWVFVGYHWEWDGRNGYVDPLGGLDVGKPDFVVKIPFALWKRGTVGYRFWFYVAGPAGVPYR